MKYILLATILSSVSLYAKAQYIEVDKPKYKMVTKDTINIRGVVYDYSGKPLSRARIVSTNKELVFLGYPIYAMTDTAGKFVLNGALPNDTLTISSGFGVKVVNRSSRYLRITLPKPEKYQLPDTATVTAKRRTAKQISTFKVLTNAGILDYFGIGPDYSEALDIFGSFQKFVRSRVSYPQKAIESNIEGEVEIGFSIERDGTVFNPYIIKGIGYGCDEVVLAIVNKSPKWRPAIQGGRPVVSKASVVVEFKLVDK